MTRKEKILQFAESFRFIAQERDRDRGRLELTRQEYEVAKDALLATIMDASDDLTE